MLILTAYCKLNKRNIALVNIYKTEVAKQRLNFVLLIISFCTLVFIKAEANLGSRRFTCLFFNFASENISFVHQLLLKICLDNYRQLPLIGSSLIGHSRHWTPIVKERDYQPQTSLAR